MSKETDALKAFEEANAQRISDLLPYLETELCMVGSHMYLKYNPRFDELNVADLPNRFKEELSYCETCGDIVDAQELDEYHTCPYCQETFRSVDNIVQLTKAASHWDIEEMFERAENGPTH